MHNTEKTAPNYTHIIIGAGSAGCVIATRLVADPSNNVLLIEAGPDYSTTDEIPIDITDATVPSQQMHDWGIKAQGTAGRSLAMIRGKLVGGTSAVNACIALRAEPTDFDAWSSPGALDWSWNSILPYYKKLETDLDFPNEDFHGSDGPLPIRRWKESEIHPLSSAMIKACSATNFEIIKDHNKPGSTGCGPLPMNAIDGRRMSTADAYLGTVRNKSNLTIVPDSVVDRIVFENNTASAVLTISKGETHVYHAQNIILSAGAFGTPAILLRSGIGNASDLEELAIPLVKELPGVGANLSDHSQVAIGVVPKSNFEDVKMPPCIQVFLRYASKGSIKVNDMQVCLLNQVQVDVFAPYLRKISSRKDLFFLTSNLMLPESRGRVFLKSINPNDNPIVELDFCKSEIDVRRHREGLKRAYTLLKDPALADLTSEILESEVLLGSDEDLNQFILHRIQTAHHPAGTAKMGAVDDPTTVVDANCKVIGLESLYVADASIIPAPIRANTNLTCIMIGERVADELMKKDRDD